MNRRLVLASASPRRRELIAQISDDVAIIPSSVDEEAVVEHASPNHPEDIVMLLAEAKARAVARALNYESIVIGADTIVWLDGKALNKPKDENDAVRMLVSLGGRTHEVYTGIALVPSGSCVLRPAVTAFERTEVEFHPVSVDAAREYVSTGQPMDKAGSYGIQDASIGKRFVKRVTGDFNNVVGLPVDKLREMLDGME